MGQLSDGALMIPRWTSGVVQLAEPVPAVIDLCGVNKHAIPWNVSFAVAEGRYRPFFASAGDEAGGGTPSMTTEVTATAVSPAIAALERFDEVQAAAELFSAELSARLQSGEIGPEPAGESPDGSQKRRALTPELASRALYLVLTTGLEQTADYFAVSTMQIRRYVEAAEKFELFPLEELGPE